MNNINFGSLRFKDKLTKVTISDIMARDAETREVVSNALEQIDAMSGQDEFVLSADKDIEPLSRFLCLPVCAKISLYNQTEKREIRGAKLDTEGTIDDLKGFFDELIDSVEEGIKRKEINHSLDKYV